MISSDARVFYDKAQFVIAIDRLTQHLRTNPVIAGKVC